MPINDTIQMLDLEAEYQLIKKDLDDAMQPVFNNAHFINGPQVEHFGEKIATYLGCRFAIPCASGTDALQVALMACGIGPGDEVITTPFTFAGTAEAICLAGATPVFVDIDTKTFNLNPNHIEDALTDKTRGIIPVHLYGQPADMSDIMALSERYNLRVIEDAAQAIGAHYDKKCVGTIGDIGCFSFYPSKNLGCYGDGGAVVTDDEKLAKRIRSIANHGVNEQGHYERVGLNSRLDTIQAAILLVKLKHLDSFTLARQNVASRYTSGLKQLETIRTPTVGLNRTHVYHQYTLRVRSREQLIAHLNSKHIPTRVYYSLPLHQQKAYMYFPCPAGCPQAEQICSEVLSLPMHPHLNDDHISHIIDTVGSFVSNDKIFI